MPRQLVYDSASQDAPDSILLSSLVQDDWRIVVLWPGLSILLVRRRYLVGNGDASIFRDDREAWWLSTLQRLAVVIDEVCEIELFSELLQNMCQHTTYQTAEVLKKLMKRLGLQSGDKEDRSFFSIISNQKGHRRF